MIFAIAHAAIVAGAFSLLLELPHITNFVVTELGKIMYGQEYLEHHKAMIPDIRKVADRVYHGEPALAHPGSFYNFIERSVHRYYVSHYRRQYQELVDLNYGPSGLISLEIRTTYILAKNPSRQPSPDPLVVPFGSSFIRTGQIQSMQAHLQGLELNVGNLEFDLNAQKTALSPAGANAPDIPLELETVGDRVDYGFKYNPAETLLSPLGELDVCIIERTQLPYMNNVYGIRMSLPTQNFTLICNAPDQVRLIPSAFDIDPKEESTEAFGHVVVAMNDWLLPGHGVCLAWDLPAVPGGAVPGSASAEGASIAK